MATRAIASSFKRCLLSTTTYTYTTTVAGALSKPSSPTSPRFIIPMSQTIFQSLHFGGIHHAGYCNYSPLVPGSNTSFNDRLIVMDKPGGDEGATKPQMIDCYVKTLAEILGSEEEAKKKIYNVSCERYFGFGCEIDEETSNKLEG